MSKKERPKIYQHTSGGGHEFIPDNPSPLKGIEKIHDYLTDRDYDLYEPDIAVIKQALTNYANMVEMLEGLRDEMKQFHWGAIKNIVIVKKINDILKGIENE
jgi:hypothetical protein